ncbi:sensor domain-containing diguanylate cyclase [Aquisalimonas asiatica]|uniref:diguanylate cyclase n=1 Tax=Aquisalimonas asiatica TaxID=406100 RepID=A0A1H8QUN7_9GAMM|nr:diguanylate cyclase [Aquisalimonas asiatica]SEO57905.1 PAS domain S-box-containing protein/diguanylate cyclase (GGDEF) domain-containing protein [Aquisalimonas asiatica]
MTAPRFSLWHKIVLPAVVLAICLSGGLLLVALVALQSASEEMERQGNRLLEEQTERFLGSLIGGVVDGADASLNLTREALTMRARGESIRDPSRVPELLDSMVQASDLVIAAHYQRADGEVVPWLSSPNDDDDLAVHLKAVARSQTIAPSQVIWPAPRESHSARVGGLVVDPMIAVHGDDGTGYLSATVSMGKLARNLNRRLPLPASYFFIMNGERQLVAATPHSRLELASAEAFRERGVIDLSTSASPSLDRALRRMADGQALMERVTIRGEDKYIVYEPMASADWHVGLVVPVSIAQQVSGELVEVLDRGAEHALRTMAVWAAVLLAGVILLTTLVARRIAAPVQHVSEVAEDIAHGNVGRRVVVRGSDEIARLGHSFNTMADQLQGFIGSLEERVRQRTAEARDARARVQRILESSPVGIAFIDATGVIQESNAEFLRLVDPAGVGHAPHSFRWHDLLRDDFNRVTDEAERTFAKGEAYDTVVTIHRADGTAFKASLRGALAHAGDPHGGFIVVLQDVSEQKRLEERLSWQASYDQLTGVLNRWRFQEVLEEGVASAQRDDRVFSVALVDVDHFKGINDRYGHTVGDQVLQEVAAQLQGALRETDSIARWGGEEFALLLAEADEALARQCAQRLCEHIALLRFGGGLRLTISAGVAVYRAEDGPDELIQRADEALYTAKRTGRNRVVSAE